MRIGEVKPAVATLMSLSLFAISGAQLTFSSVKYISANSSTTNPTSSPAGNINHDAFTDVVVRASSRCGLLFVLTVSHAGVVDGLRERERFGGVVCWD